MTLLLDTQVLLWAASRPQRLSPAARRLLTQAGNALVFSAASLWEIAIKFQLGRHDFPFEPGVFRRELLENGYEELAVTGQHAETLTALPALHKDPFDRMLLAQAISEGITLVTTDARLALYPGPIRKV